VHADFDSRASRKEDTNKNAQPQSVAGHRTEMWWSWGDSNPRPQAFVAQFYMFSGLI